MTLKALYLTYLSLSWLVDLLWPKSDYVSNWWVSSNNDSSVYLITTMVGLNTWIDCLFVPSGRVS